MPPFVPLVNGAQVEIGMSLGGKNIECRLWFRDRSPLPGRNPPIDPTHLQQLADGVRDWWEAEVMPLLSQDLSFLSVIATDWTGSAPGIFEQATSSAVGGQSEKSYPANCAVRVRFTGDNSQTFPDNANFVPGIPDSAVTLNTLSSSLVNGLFEAYVDLIDLAAVFGTFPAWRWVVTSRVLAGAYRATQAFARTDFIHIPSPYISPRRHRLP